MPTTNGHPVRVELARRREPATALARRIGVKPNTLYAVLNGATRPWPKIISAIADDLGIDGEELFPESHRAVSP